MTHLTSSSTVTDTAPTPPSHLGNCAPTSGVIYHEYGHMFQDATVDLDWYHNPTGEAGADLFASFVAAYVDVNPRTGCVDCWEDNFAHRNQTFIEEPCVWWFPLFGTCEFHVGSYYDRAGVLSGAVSALWSGATNPYSGVVVPGIGVKKLEQLWLGIFINEDIPSDASMGRVCTALKGRAQVFVNDNSPNWHQQDVCAVNQACASIGYGDDDPQCVRYYDGDFDRIADIVDNCDHARNPRQDDLDADGLGDACDDDLDGDTILNAIDNCVAVPNDTQEDSDADGKGDACDHDRDNDYVWDDDDNCPDVENYDQSDADLDWLGDACDPDIDGDSVSNEEDNCVWESNNSQHNNDTDKWGDACDNCDDAYNPGQGDLDKDGLGDVCDDDDDGDLVDDGADNCPKKYNPDQVNNDGDADGFACDADELEDWFAQLRSKLELVITAQQLQHDPTQWLPIPLCEPQGCTFHDPNATLELTVRTRGEVMAVVLNDLGMWRAEGVATYDGDEVVNRITWHPDQTASTMVNEFGGTNYHLLMIADPASYQDGEPLSIGLSLTEYSEP